MATRGLARVGRWVAGGVRTVERVVFHRLFGGLPAAVQDALERAAALPDGDGMVQSLLRSLGGLTPSERLVWAAAAGEVPDRTAVSAYWVSLVALLLATAALLSGGLRTLLLVATAACIFIARYQARHAARLRIPGNLLRTLVAADGSVRADLPPSGDR